MCHDKIRKSVVRLNHLILLAMIFVLLASPSSAIAQVGKETSLWQWSSTSSHHDSIVQIESGGGIGTGVIIRVDLDKPVGEGFEGWCLTAWHVVSDDNGQREIGIKYRNGSRAKRCKVLEYDEQHDVALLWVWVPRSIQPAMIATAPIEVGHQIEFAGLGGGSSLQTPRHFTASASMATNANQMFADAPLLPGDSGGPVFTMQGEVAAIISGGWFWLDAGVKDDQSGLPIRVTWPARAGNLGTIQSLLNKAEMKTELLASK